MTPEQLRQLDKQHFWHPFTQMRSWMADDHDPLVIASGRGAVLTDIDGNDYLDGNSSIWTNLHGHGHPALVAAIRDQAEQLAHCSALGSSNEPAIHLAAELVGLFPPDTLSRVFFSDDGSTAIECACRMALQYRQLTGQGERRGFLAFDQAYHGDTIGAASLGGIAAFHRHAQTLGFPVTRIAGIEELDALPADTVDTLAAVCVEPLIQGAAGMRTWPAGMLSELRNWCDRHDVHLILDEVMTGFGRTGKMFACEHEGVVPDFIALAKGLSGGTVPLAATLTTERVFSAFLGETAELKTFFYGHSYCGNPLGCRAALANLQIFRDERTLEQLPAKIARLAALLQQHLALLPQVAEIRQCGMIAGIDIRRADGTAYPWEQETGHRICGAARRRGLLTRPVRDTLVLMPPLCTTEEQLERAVIALQQSVREVCADGLTDAAESGH